MRLDVTVLNKECVQYCTLGAKAYMSYCDMLTLLGVHGVTVICRALYSDTKNRPPDITDSCVHVLTPVPFYNNTRWDWRLESYA